MSPSSAQARWLPTAAHVRASVLAAGLLLVGGLARRPDLVVLAAPFALLAAWGACARPGELPSVSTRLHPSVLSEGQSLTWQAFARVPTGTRDVCAVLAPTPYLPPLLGSDVAAVGVGADHAPDIPLVLSTTRQALRWGHLDTGAAIVSVTTRWGAFRWTPAQLREHRVVVLPAKEMFTSRAGMPHPVGIVGRNRGARRGEGSDFAAVRAYGPGDRLARINWARSTRSGDLLVTATHADLDTHVQLVIDAFHDIGDSGGIDGASSSLDTAVRASTAIAEHYLRAGERVGLIVLGVRGLAPVPARSGRPHLRRIQDTAAAIRPGTLAGTDEAATATALRRLTPGAVTLLLTPGVSPAALGHAMRLSGSGATVLVIDTLPPVAMHPERLSRNELEALAPMTSRREIAATRIAWRLRLLERRSQFQRLGEVGVSVIAWHGAGSLDDMLRQLQRRARAPRPARR